MYPCGIVRKSKKEENPCWSIGLACDFCEHFVRKFSNTGLNHRAASPGQLRVYCESRLRGCGMYLRDLQFIHCELINLIPNFEHIHSNSAEAMEVQCYSAPAADLDSVSFLSASFESQDWTSLCNMDSGSFEDLSEFLGEEEQNHPGSCLKKGSTSARKYAVLAEQGRRKRMKALCAQLSSVVPNASAQTNRVRLYEAAMTHIKELEGQLKQLTAKKNSLLKMQGHQQSSETTTTAADLTMVNIFIFGREVSITVNSPRKPRSVSNLLRAVENQNIHIESFQMFSWDFEVSCSFRAFLREEDSKLDLTQTRNLLEELLKRVY